jgi:hypothetical protein
LPFAGKTPGKPQKEGSRQPEPGAVGEDNYWFPPFGSGCANLIPSIRRIEKIAAFIRRGIALDQVDKVEANMWPRIFARQ